MIHEKLSAEDFWPIGNGRCCELIDGEVVELTPTSPEHGMVETNLAILVGAHVKSRRLGCVLTGDVGFIVAREPDSVRAPDIAFIEQHRIPESGVPKGFWEIVPDLVIEIVSPSDSRRKLSEKTRMWIDAGVSEAWIVDPESQEIEVHSPDRTGVTFRGRDELKSATLTEFTTTLDQVFGL